MKILIIGAGGVGGYYAAKLARTGVDVVLLARGKTLEVLREQDLRVQSYQGDFSVRVPVIDKIDKTLQPECIVIAVKTYDTDTVLDQIKPVVGPKTTVLSLQNGVEKEEKITKAFGRDHALGAVCYIGAEMKDPGLVVHSARGSVAFGEMNGRMTERLQEIAKIFRDAGIDTATSLDIRKDLWIKLAWNAAFNQVCAVAHCSVGEALDKSLIEPMLGSVMKEVQAIARAKGILLTDDDLAKSLEFSRKELKPVRPSMLQDLERGRRMEQEAFGGYLAREGKTVGVSTPLNDSLYRILSFWEKNPSSFSKKS